MMSIAENLVTKARQERLLALMESRFAVLTNYLGVLHEELHAFESRLIIVETRRDSYSLGEIAGVQQPLPSHEMDSEITVHRLVADPPITRVQESLDFLPLPVELNTHSLGPMGPITADSIAIDAQKLCPLINESHINNCGKNMLTMDGNIADEFVNGIRHSQSEIRTKIGADAPPYQYEMIQKSEDSQRITLQCFGGTNYTLLDNEGRTPIEISAGICGFVGLEGHAGLIYEWIFAHRWRWKLDPKLAVDVTPRYSVRVVFETRGSKSLSPWIGRISSVDGTNYTLASSIVGCSNLEGSCEVTFLTLQEAPRNSQRTFTERSRNLQKTF
jgi:hypothetical protein